MISIIIPTLNEENYLPKLLKCIKRQSYKNYEVIVVDANSKDKTREIAANYGFKVVLEPKNKKSLPGIARNVGAKISKGDILLFLDADSQIDNDFLKNAVEEMYERKIDVAGAYFSPICDKIIDKLLLGAFNFWSFLTQLFFPHAATFGLFCKKWLHKKVKGFDERIQLAEDMDYVQRCAKYGKFRVIRSARVYVSMRRFDNEGRLKVALKLLLSGTYRLLFGPVKTDIFRYRFDYKK